MNVLACLPPAPAQSLAGTPEEAQLLTALLQRVTEEQRDTAVSTFEKDGKNVLFLLRKANHDVDKAYKGWEQWSKWRRDKCCDTISTEEIASEIADNICVWRGRDKAGRLVCVVTGRHMKLIGRKGTTKSFEKFMIKTVEDGIRLSNGSAGGGDDQVCVVYDRRGLTFDNIDGLLSKYCKPVFNSLTDFYGNRMGVLYVVHVNWFFKVVVDWVLKPLLNWVGMHDKIVFVDDEKELREKYFDGDQAVLFDIEQSE